MIRITQLKLSINHTPEELSQKIRKELRLKNEGFTYEIVKQSLDCRHKEDKKFVYTVDVSLQDKNQESKIFRRVHNNNIMLTQKKEYTFPSPGEEKLKYPPVIVGSGPAGIFCAWYLAKAGYRPLVLELDSVALQRAHGVHWGHLCLGRAGGGGPVLPAPAAAQHQRGRSVHSGERAQPAHHVLVPDGGRAGISGGQPV